MSIPLPVVCNAGPWMVLAKLNVLHLLKQLYGRVHFARSVYEEVVGEGMRRGHADAATLNLFLNQMQWTAEDVDSTGMLADLRVAHLDRGERDTLALAQSFGQCRVLIDEVAGRRVARALGLEVRGSLGILIESYQQRLLDSDQLRLHLAEIARRRDIWINPALVDHLARDVFGV